MADRDEEAAFFADSSCHTNLQKALLGMNRKKSPAEQIGLELCAIVMFLQKGEAVALERGDWGVGPPGCE